MWTVFYLAPCLIPSCPAYEPNSKDGVWSQPLRHIQYKQTAMRRPIATLAMLLCNPGCLQQLQPSLAKQVKNARRSRHPTPSSALAAFLQNTLLTLWFVA
jgi:hypothetical protein